MRGKSVLFFLGCFLAFALVNGAALAQPYDGFQYMKLALQWPASHCQLKSCKATIPPYFTIHGLWPDNYTGRGLANCYDQPYVTITDNELLQRLTTSWPNLETKRNNRFWNREWTKYGTCSLSLYNQTEYFEKALELKERYGLVEYLNTNGISPGPNATYSAETIIEVVQELTGAVPEVYCPKKKKSGMQFLSEIRICFIPSGANTTDCPKGRGPPQCSGNATFPEPPSGGLRLSA